MTGVICKAVMVAGGTAMTGIRQQNTTTIKGKHKENFSNVYGNTFKKAGGKGKIANHFTDVNCFGTPMNTTCSLVKMRDSCVYVCQKFRKTHGNTAHKQIDRACSSNKECWVW